MSSREEYRLPSRLGCVLASFMSAVLSAPSLPARFAAAIGLLCRGLAVSLPQNWGNAALALSAWTRLRRLLARFAALAAAVEAGRFSVPRRKAAASSRPRPAATAVRLPGGSGWLLRLAPALETRLGRSQVESLLGDPELGALLAQAPQAGRILRPLCHMLGIEPPTSLRLPRRHRARHRPDRSGGTEAEATGGEASLGGRSVPHCQHGWPCPPRRRCRSRCRCRGEHPPSAPPDLTGTGPPGPD